MTLTSFSDFCAQAVKDGMLFYYTGEFSKNVIGAMSDTLRHRLDSTSLSAPSRRKIFSTFVELSQNVLHYGDPEQDGAKIGALAVGHNGDKYYVMCGNTVRVEYVDRIKENIEPLRNMTIEEIKAAYREQLRNDEHEQEDSISKGAGLGFLTVARDASEPIEYQIVYRSANQDYAEFYLRAAI
ncbi:MAG TPA: SiaB family protein kinase [Rhodocyclaceae bacterium]|jgi:hypothetical protein|nr:SiaB family protein kinase [Rhodocyclaceae bacterium]